MNDSNGIFGGSWLFAFLIIALLFGGGNGLGWGNSGANVETAINSAINNQSTQASLRDVLLSSAKYSLIFTSVGVCGKFFSLRQFVMCPEEILQAL